MVVCSSSSFFNFIKTKSLIFLFSISNGGGARRCLDSISTHSGEAVYVQNSTTNRRMRLKTTARKGKCSKFTSTEVETSNEAHYESPTGSALHQDNDDDDDMLDAANRNGKEQRFSRPNEDNEDTDYLLERSSCISCSGNDGRGNRLLVCKGNGCPISIHEACMAIKPAIDDQTGNFYCPYCWYKRQLSEVKRLQMEMMLARKNLTNFLSPNLVTEKEKGGKSK